MDVPTFFSMATRPRGTPSTDMESFTKHLKGSKRILALFGAGLSAASGLPTFRGAGGMWRKHEATGLATPEAFSQDPGLVWQFYNYRRHMAIKAQPNRAHKALAALAKHMPGFLALSQNVDGLCQRAGHPKDQLALLHGSIFDIKCFNCDYITESFEDPIIPALAIPRKAAQILENANNTDATGEGASAALHAAMNEGPELDISDASVPLAHVPASELPHCPKCKTGLLRPGVVWFGEALPEETMEDVDEWISEDEIDLMLVVGTSAVVYPAAGYTEIARSRGARVAVVNMDKSSVQEGMGGITENDWFFEGDANEIVPEMLKCLVGEIR